MAKGIGQMPDCPPCGPDAVFPVCRAIALSGGWCNAADFGETNPFRKSAFATTALAAPGEVFSTRRPRDAIAGASSGLKTFARSIASGAVSLACSPIEGARESGTQGALKGLGEGAANAFLLPCAGAVIGLTQCARGLVNTPMAMAESLRGHQWDYDDRSWVPASYSLPEEAKLLRVRRHNPSVSTNATGSRGKRGDFEHEDPSIPGTGTSSSSRARADRVGRDSGAQPRRCSEDDTTHADGDTGSAAGTVQRQVSGASSSYYALLQVQPSANSNEIRRAYYRASRRCHPDKVGGTDRRAVVRFQQVSEAYKILRSPELRRAYDRGGREAVVRMSTTVDLGVLYSVVMSGAQWEPHVGCLALSRILSCDLGDEESNEGGGNSIDALAELCLAGAADAVSDEWQIRREINCAVALAERLQPAVTGSVAAFESKYRDEVVSLADAPFAPGILYTMAAVYETEAARFLGALKLLDLRREMAEVHAQGRLLAHQARAATAGIHAAVALHSLLEDDAASGTSSPSSSENRQDNQKSTTSLCLERPAVQAQLPTLATALWRLTVLDIEGTLRRVCRRILRDTSTDIASRIRRAEALQVAARVLREVADSRLEANDPAAGVPGEDAELLQSRIKDAAMQLASGASAAERSDQED